MNIIRVLLVALLCVMNINLKAKESFEKLEGKTLQEKINITSGGYVEFVFDIDLNGVPFNVAIVDSQPTAVYDEEASKAIKKWKFKVKLIDGKPVVQKRMKYTINFALNPEEK